MVAEVMNLDVQAKNLEQVLKLSEQFAKNMRAGAEAASSIRMPKAAKDTAAFKSGMGGAISPDELAGYGVARSAAGTGAASRDFAKQAQGLGGLVHLYATFAANLFAVSTAFTQLSKAMDTTNMVRGLDQLGASSGRALGSIAKHIVTLTDGAVSLRGAMDATAKATSAGFSTKQIEQLTLVAKKSSQALGIGMEDAISRLTRATSKLEPELIDELGLMTKIGPATDAYARQVGKAASTLTDFEKRQAFANAVIQEGLDKFGAIDIDANPYNKLLASLQNLLQTGLEVVNKVFAPIASFLSQSPTALAAAVGLVIATLVKQAIPAIGAIRENAEKQVEQAKRLADARIKLTKETADKLVKIDHDANVARLKDQLATMDKEAELAHSKLEAAEASTKDLLSKRQLGKASILKQIAKADNVLAITPEQIAELDKLANKLNGTASGYGKIRDAILEVQQANKDYITKRKELEGITDETKRAELAKKASEELLKSNNTYQKNLKEAAAAQQKFQQQQIKNNAVQNTQMLGMSYAWKQLGKDIEEARSRGEMGSVAAGWTKVSGAVKIATTAVLGFAGAVNTIFMVIGALVAVFGVLDSLFGKNAKQAEAFASSIDSINTSVSTLNNTLDLYSKDGFKNWFTTDGIKARANAMVELVDSTKSLITNLEAVRNARSGFDSTTNFFKTFVGLGDEQKARRQLSNSLAATIRGLDTSEARQAATAKMSEVFKADIKFGNANEIDAALGNMQSNEQAIAALKELLPLLEKYKNAQGEAALVQANAKEKLDGIVKTYQEFGLSLKINTPLANFASSIIQSTDDISKALEDPINSLGTLQEIAKTTQKLALLDPTDAIRLQKELPKIVAYTNQVKSYEESILQIKQKVAEAEIQAGKDIGTAREGRSATALAKAKAELQLITEALQVARKELSDVSADPKFANLFASSAKKMAEIIAKEFDTASKLASLTISKSLASGLQGPGAATIQSNISQQEIKIQLESIAAMDRLVSGLESNTQALIEAKAAPGSDEFNIAKQAGEFLSKNTADFIKEFRAILEKKDRTTIESGLIKQLFPTYERKLGVQKQAVGLNAQSTVINQEKDFAERKAQQAANAQAEASRITNAKILLDIQKQSNSYLEASNTLVFAETRDKERQLLADENRQAVQAAINNLEEQRLRLQKDGKLNTTEGDKILANARDQVSQALALKKSKEQQFDYAQKIAAIDRDLSALTKRNELEYAYAQIQRDAATSNLTQEEQALNIFKERTGLSASVITGLETELAINRELAASKQAQAELEKAKNAEIAASNAQLAKVLADPKASDTSKSAAIGDAEMREANINALYAQRSKLISENTSASIKYSLSLDETKKNQIAINEVTESLAVIFEDLGKSMGGVVNSLAKFVKGSKDLSNVQGKRIDEMKKAGKTETQINAQREKDGEERKRFELSSAAEIAGATKELFGKKTFAYKAFAAIEKTLHIARLGMMASEVAATLLTEAQITGIKQAGFFARIPLYITEIFASITSQLGVFGPIVAAGIVAAIFGGKGGGKAMAGMTSQDRQSTQGTGQSWKNGEKVDNGGGVFGDTSAKSESISKSLEVIKNTSVEGLSYDNKMLNALIGIKDAISGTAIKLYSAAGIAKGSAFGTDTNPQVNTIGLKGLFGKTSTTEIIDTGIKLVGSFTDLAKGMSGTVQQYETLQNTVKKSGFLGIGSSSSTTYYEQFKNANDDITKAISSIFSNAAETFVVVGSKLGMTAESVLSKLGDIKVDQLASLKGLSGAELEKEFSSIISNILDTASSALFSSLEKYKKFGEGLLETVVRVVDSNDKIKLALDSIGKKYTEISFDVSEALVNAAGDLGTFLDQVAYFKDNFLSEVEKLKPVQDSVTNTLAELGYSSIQTRDQFKALVNSLDLTSPAAQKIYQALMNLAPAFVAITEQMQDLIDSNKNLEVEILKAVNSEAARAEVLKRSTEGMNAATLAEFTRNKQLETQLETIKQYNDLQKDLISAQDALLSDADKLLATRARERVALADVNKPLYDLVNAYTDLKSANDTMASALVSMQSTMNSLASAAESAASRVKNAGKALASGYKTAQDKSSAAAKATQSAVTNIAKGYLSAKSAVDSAMKQVADAQASASKAIKDSLRELAKSIRDFIIETSTSELGINSPGENQSALMAQFDALASAARGGDQVAMGKLTDVAQQLLTISKDQSSSALAYARTYGFVIGTLDEISNSAATMAGPAEDTSQSQIADALTQLSSAQDDLVLWQKLINDNGIDANKYAESTATTIANLQQELNDANAAQALADSETAMWQDKLAAAGIDTALYTENTAEGIDALIKEFQDATVANTKAQADLLAAQQLTKSYTFTAVTELQNLQKSMADYESARAIATAAQEIIANTNTQAIVDAINNLASALITPADTTANKSVIGVPEKIFDTMRTAATADNSQASAVNDSIYNTSYNKYSDMLPDWNNIASFDEGTGYVPKTGYALIHEGEKITPAKYNNDNDEAIISELQALREEVAKLRMISDQTEYNTRKSKETLQQVTAGNDYLQIKAV